MGLAPERLALASAVGATLLAITTVQIGASLAVGLIGEVGAAGAVALRLLGGTALLLAVFRPWRMLGRIRDWRAIVAYGVVLGLMNLSFYASIARIPLGLAVAIEFVGPLAVAMSRARRPLELLWVVLAIAGLILILRPTTTALTSLDGWGVALALAAGVFWGLYILFSQKVGGQHGVSAVAIGMVIAAAVVVPIGVTQAGARLATPHALVLGGLVGLLCTALPYALEMFALTRLSAGVFGIMMSLEPAIGALAGLIVLGQALTSMQWLALALVMCASAGATATMPAVKLPPLEG